MFGIYIMVFAVWQHMQCIGLNFCFGHKIIKQLCAYTFSTWHYPVSNSP